ncbi:MAG TPA: TetR/AcrR family transcriptional regulator [Actinoplanes sp.]|nr:TetR/AcrR family transcriptional regulator [Actinoplanes sp.]
MTRTLAEDDVPELVALLLANRAFLEPWDPIRADDPYSAAGQLDFLRDALAGHTTVPRKYSWLSECSLSRVRRVTRVRRRRVPALAPEERRAALVDATVPLLHQHGLEVSTKQIATAAGVAEGTIFGVFPDKHSLILAALARALDPQPTIDALAAVDRGADLRTRLTAAAELINRRFTTNFRLLSAARTLALSTGEQAMSAMRIKQSQERLQAAIADLIEPDAAALRRSPAATARLLLMIIGANTFGPYADGATFQAADLVSLLLDGLLVTIIENGEGPC